MKKKKKKKLKIKLLIHNNNSKFCFSFCLLVFSIFISCRLDGFILWSYWWVLSPLYFLDLLVFGSFTFVVCKILHLRIHHSQRLQPIERMEFFHMLSIVCYYLMFLTFKILVCVNIQGSYLNWGAIFLPLEIISFVSTFMYAYWKFQGRNAGFEGLLSLGFFFFLFISLQINGSVTWVWRSVFSTVWIVFILFILYSIYLCLLIPYKKKTFAPIEEQISVKFDTIDFSVKLYSALAFSILLVLQLQGQLVTYYVLVFIPLFFLLSYIVWTSFLKKGGNPWWYGNDQTIAPLKKLLPKFGVISYSFQPPESNGDVQIEEITVEVNSNTVSETIPLYKSIETPD